MPINPHQLQPWKYICEAGYKRVNLGVVLNKLSSWVLLAAYILMVSHQSIGHSHSHAEDLPKPTSSSHHHGIQDRHHEHHFHVGIFHFLSHLFENFNHGDEKGHEYVSSTFKYNARENLAPDFIPFLFSNIELIEQPSIFNHKNWFLPDNRLSEYQLLSRTPRGPPILV